jgi:hypothetical protein
MKLWSIKIRVWLFGVSKPLAGPSAKEGALIMAVKPMLTIIIFTDFLIFIIQLFCFWYGVLIRCVKDFLITIEIINNWISVSL